MAKSPNTVPLDAPERIDTPSARAGAQDFTCPWWVVGALVLAFVALALVTAGSNTLAIDLRVSERLQSIDNDFARFLGWFGDHLGGTTTGLTCLTIGLVAAALLRSWRDAWFLGIAVVLRLGATVLKGLSDSPRPTADQVDQLTLYQSAGFPSGHVTTATLVMGTLAFMVGRRTGSRAIWIALGALWAIGVLLSAFGRIWHGAHWLSDTVGGAITGVVIVLVAANLSAAIMQTRSTDRQTPRSRMQAR